MGQTFTPSGKEMWSCVELNQQLCPRPQKAIDEADRQVKFRDSGRLYTGLLNCRQRINTLAVIKMVTHYLYQGWRYGCSN